MITSTGEEKAFDKIKFCSQFKTSGKLGLGRELPTYIQKVLNRVQWEGPKTFLLQSERRQVCPISILEGLATA